MKLSLKPATLIKRYKRFLTDIELPNSEVTTIHCANTGAMTGCADSGNRIWYSTSDNPKRKYPFSWEISTNKQGHNICVNTLRANQLVEEALNHRIIPSLDDFETLAREVKYGDENSKVDFLLTTHQNKQAIQTFIEVKSVTLLDESRGSGQGFFPDAVTTRGQKHLRELIEMVEQGHRAVLFFAVLHEGIQRVEAAKHIDAKYHQLLLQAREQGVEVIAYRCRFLETQGEFELALADKIPVNFST